MTEAASISWPALLALGAGHGINPAMGWLFAVALGLQRGSRRAVWASLGPLAVGHAAAIAAAIDEGVPVPVLSAALYDRFSSRGIGDFGDKVLSALRYQFGGHEEKSTAAKGVA